MMDIVDMGCKAEDMLFLKEGARSLGFCLEDHQAQLLLHYRYLLEEGNKVVNLTAITSAQEVLIKHFLDSLSIIPMIDKVRPSTIIDVGTGAGFPGIPIKIVRNQINITLLDSLKKRINFLENTIKELALEKIEAIHQRAEDIAKSIMYRERFDVAVSRAVAQLAILSEYCLPFVRLGGHFVAYKGTECEQEVKSAEKAIQVLGGEIIECTKVSLPYSDISHLLILIKKTRHTPSQYPRKAGTPSKTPLT